MNGEELLNIAGVSFTDIITDSYNLLTERKWDVTASGIGRNVKEWLENKDEKIRRMAQNPYYNGNLQLVVPISVRREACPRDASNLLRSLISKMELENKYIDPDGKNAMDYITGKKIVTADDLDASLKEKCDYVMNNFDGYFKSMRTMGKINDMQTSLRYIRDELGERISEGLATTLNRILHLEKKKIIAGQKTSKVVNRILNMGDYNRLYNGLFTQFANLINENTVDMYFIVSLNFLDYLRMSDGNSWASCHTTDYKNTRGRDNTYSGAYCQGCLSYANDEVSYVCYIVPTTADLKHPERTDKVYRNMIHVSNDFDQIIQGRVYPQGNDGHTDIYQIMFDKFMETMQLDKESYDRVGRAEDEAYISTCGANYEDYFHFSNCTYFLKCGRDQRYINIGNVAYSCKTGYELNTDDHGTIV